MLMCKDHPNYKGTTWKKNRCPTCDKIFKEIKSQSCKYGEYYSITTPDFKCGLIHLLAEISCVMLYGKLPPFFWRVGGDGTQVIRKHFYTLFSMLKAWQNRNPNALTEIRKILYITFGQYQIRKLANERREELKVEEKSIEPIITPAPKVEFVNEEKSKLNPWKIMNEE